MQIKANGTKGLIAITNQGKLVKIPNQVMRKRLPVPLQRKLNLNSICITCNYSFYERCIPWAPNVAAVCHPFRSNSVFPPTKSFFSFAESDMCDESWIKAGEKDVEVVTIGKDNNKKVVRPIYDFVYFTIRSIQGVRCKGLHLLQILQEVCDEKNYKGLMIDYFNMGNPHKERPSNRAIEKGSEKHAFGKINKSFHKCDNIDLIEDSLNEGQLNYITRCAKFMFFPNTRDASPRMIPETIIRGIPVLVNDKIYGGSRYVNDNTGCLFNGGSNYWEVMEKRDLYKDNLINAIDTMKSKEFNPRQIKKAYYKKFGFVNTAKRLAHIINQIEGKNMYKYVCYAEFKNLLKQIED